MQSLPHTLLESYYDFTMTLIIHTDAEISIMLCQGFSEENILSLLSNHMRHIFDDLYRDHILGRDKLGSSTVDKTSAILWDTLQSHELMSEFSKHDIKRHPSITFIFVCFIITANILEPLQEIYYMKRDIKVLSTK